MPGFPGASQGLNPIARVFHTQGVALPAYS
jgi:hypothetical protein